jgi:rRNA maturation endonuclease Nob1
VAAGQVQSGVEDRRVRFGLIVCQACGALVPEDAYCFSCGTPFSRQAVIDLLVALGARKPDVDVLQ